MRTWPIPFVQEHGQFLLFKTMILGGTLMGPYPLPVFNPYATIYSNLKVFFGGGHSVSKARYLFTSFLGKIFVLKVECTTGLFKSGYTYQSNTGMLFP